jgi:uncharacterized membrane protein (UPF0182 family)
MVYDYYQEKTKKGMKKLIAPLICLIAVIAAIAFGTGIYLEIIQLDEIGQTGQFSSVYLTNLVAKAVSFAAGFLIIFAIIAVTNGFIKRNINAHNKKLDLPQQKVPNILVALVVAFLGALLFKEMFYEKILYFLNGTLFHTADPIFGRDTGYYIFERPLYSALYSFASTLCIFLIAYTIIYYIGLLMANTSGSLSTSDLKIKSIITHNLINVALFFLVKASAYGLVKQEILYGAVEYGSGEGYIGASYVDVNIWMKYYTVAPFIVIAATVAALFLIRKGKLKQAAISFAVYPAVWLVVTGVAMFTQSILVTPNVLEYEKKYIANNITETRKAYGLDKIKTYNFTDTQELTPDILKRNQDTMSNVRIVDIKSTLASNVQLQSNTAFYSFSDGDIINYEINGKETPVFITAREIDKNKLPDKTYLNTTYRYTHGYGIVINPINKITSKGQVDFIMSGLDNKCVDPSLKIGRPEIYYGELTEDHVITQGKDLDEITYDGGRSTVYEGKGGIRLNFLNKVLFSLKYSDFKMLISGYTSNADLLLNRQIVKRAQKALPFLSIDDDPYIIPTADGRLKWVLDAYTTSDRFPNAQSYRGVNYIRNSAKIVIDAYDGKLECFIIDRTDPIIQTLDKIYPNAFSSRELPAEIAGHTRYPELLFKIQTEMLKKYHILPDKVNDFYSKQDLWDIAKHPVNRNSDELQEIDPYYNMIRLPEELGEKAELILMRPFTPFGTQKHNMVSWLAVRNSSEHYGELILFNFPKNQNILGPNQVEVKINQIDQISEDMTLWGQSGSDVYKGNLLVIPIENSILYVEPIYLKANNTSASPEVKEIVVGYQSGDEFMYGIGANLDKALADLFSGTAVTPPAGQGGTKPPEGTTGNENVTGGENGQNGLDREKVDQILSKYDELKQQLDELGKLIEGLK